MTGTSASSTITRRTALGLFAAAGVGYIALGPRRSSGSRDGNRIVVDYWEKWTGHEAAAMKKVVDAFNQSQGRILVNYLTMSGIDQKAKISIAGGDPPGVLGLWDRNVPFFVQCGALQPLENLAGQGITREYYAPALVPLLFTGSIQVCAPSTPSSVALYYNREIFREVGLDPDAPPETLEQFDQMIRQLTVLDDQGNVMRAGFLPSDPGWWSWCWGYFFGGSLYDQSTGVAHVDSSQNIRGYDWYQSFPKRWGLERMRRFQGALVDNPSPYRDFFSGRLATTLQGPWLPMFMEQDLGKDVFDYGACPFPVPADLRQPGSPYGPIESDVLIVPTGAPDPEASMEFIGFTQTPEMMELLNSGHAKPSPLAESSESFRKNHPNRAVMMHEAILRSPNGFTTPRIAEWDEFGDALGSAIDAIGNLRSDSATKPLQRVQVEVTEILRRAAARRRRRGQPDPWEGTGT